MQNKSKIIFLVIAVMFVFIGVNYVFAGDLNFTNDTDIVLGVGNFVIQAGSTANSVNVGGVDDNTLSIVVPVNSSLTLISPDRYLLSNDQGLKQNCSIINNSVVVDGPQTISFTPSSVICTTSITGAGIISSGGKTKEVLQKTFKINSSIITKNKRKYDFGLAVLKNGSKGNAVKELQRFFNDIMKLGLLVDGKLGSKTVLIIKKWQKAHGLKTDGIVGTKTKIMMNAEVQ